MIKLLFLVVTLLLVSSINAQHAEDPSSDSSAHAVKSISPRKSTTKTIGNNHIHIEYSSPSVRGRTIWNGLVAYKQVWVTGAHSATSIEFSQSVIIAGKMIPKGKYGFFTIPDKKQWTIILNKKWNMHLADGYTPTEDAIRITATPTRNKFITEQLMYEITSTGNNKVRISMSWEYLKIAFDVKNEE
jgi:hypothetical protein